MGSSVTGDTADSSRPRPTTIGEVLAAGESDEPRAERAWVVLVNLVAAGDQRALRELFERTHRLVFSLITRITHNRETADNLTVEVFHEVWRKAPTYDPVDGSVIGWIMSEARAKALDRLRVEQELDADILIPTTLLWGAIAKGIVSEFGHLPAITAPQTWIEPEWREAAPGVSCKVLATDNQRDRVTMLVRVAPGAEYPARTHVGVEELHVLRGDVRIGSRKLNPGDYSRAEPGTADARLSSDTGCICLLITSPRDELG